MQKKILVLLLGLALVAAACNKTTSDNSSTTNTNSTNTSSNDQSNQQPSESGEQIISGETTINMTATGFSPANITVKQGTKVIFKNADSNLHWPASDPHPTHTDLPGFDADKGLTNGQTYTYTFDKVGRWKFHDHLNSGLRGSVTVVQ